MKHGRPPLISDNLVPILDAQILVSRTIGAFPLTDLSENWGISTNTLYRYHSPAYRVASRVYTRQAYQVAKANKRTGCYRCGGDIALHPRCPSCEILIHGSKTCGSGYCG